ncbi:hypothetical protein B6D60_01005 [candidate division KSB1 bacterium 4484_87]|nr:MAG: hypothetical protein B6D60_01005 [candidate division KSB1 bacterium 4484_87]
MSLFRQCVFFLFVIFLPFLSSAQDYLWPTNASHYLTSSFAEYRPGHFHAGIDIKTWGREGYKVYAVRDGYIWQIRVSPFGYGKVIYQKLDTGEIALYAHLSGFMDDLQRVVKSEQKRRGRYRISKYFDARQFPVKKGDVIGYTGSTGIGYPHLHFELRDKQNRPINPFLRGYRVKDRVKPRVSALAIIPMEASSRVNGDVVPLILPMEKQMSGDIQLETTIVVSGKIGFAVQCWDQANDVSNKFSVHRLRLFIDDDLKFSVHYDRFSYAETHFIDFDRNYRLRKRGIGLFQNLFKSKHNMLHFYQPSAANAGILLAKPDGADSLKSKNVLNAGRHSFRIESLDFWGNETVIHGSFIVEHKKRLVAHFILAQDTLKVKELQDQFGTPVLHPEVLILKKSGTDWQGKFAFPKVLTASDPTERFDPFIVFPVAKKTLVKISAVDSLGVSSYPLYFVPGWQFSLSPSQTSVRIEKDFYDDYVRFEILATNGVVHTPQMIVYRREGGRKRIPLVQKDLNDFFGVYQLNPDIDGELIVDFSGYDENMAPVALRDKFSVHPIVPEVGGKLMSDDRKCEIIFEKNKVYDPLYLRMNCQDSVAGFGEPLLSKIYEFYPNDVLLKGAATLTLSYPADDSLPDKLAIYGIYGKSAGFVGNKIDTAKKIISARVGSLGAFALLRDTEPPEIYVFYPKQSAAKRIYTFRAKITDKLAGIENERAIRMFIDGTRVIAEYDPEQKTITYRNDVPLLPGKHFVKVTAVDRSGNRAGRRRSFIVQ